MEVIVYPRKGLETHGLFTALVRVFTVPLLNHVPPYLLRSIMRRSSRDASQVLNNMGYTHALEVVYTRYHRKLFHRGLMQGVADLFWHHATSQAKALRNRLKIVEHTLESEIHKRLAATSENRVSLCTVGGGSSRAIIHTMSRVTKAYPLAHFEITNIDKDANGMELGRKNAAEYGLDSIFRWVRDDARNIPAIIPPETADIVEMVGLLDYFSEERGIEVIRHIHGSLKPGGVFIVANVHPNREQRFLHNMGWPSMHYRKPAQLTRILSMAGFSNEPLVMFEPLRVHMISVVVK